MVLNALPGAAAALLLGWGLKEAVLLAGITYISSSGVISKVLTDLGRLGNRETPAILTVLVLEDLAMTLYLPVAAVVIAGDEISDAAVTIAIALSVTLLALVAAMRYGHHLTRAISTRSDEALLLGVLGVTLLAAGAAQELEVSAAIGAFLVGVALSGTVQQRASALIEPLRDLFAALFFVLFGLQVDIGSLPPVLLAASLLASGDRGHQGGDRLVRGEASRRRRARARASGRVADRQGRVLDRDRRPRDREHRRPEARAARGRLRVAARDRGTDHHALRRPPRAATVAGHGTGR